jgi:hypothetical protein
MRRLSRQGLTPLFPRWRFASQSRDARGYSFSRRALNTPCFDGRSPTRGKKSTSPIIKSAVSNLPLQTNVPASRPTLPIRNSTGPENVTEFPTSRVHFASEGLASPQTLDSGLVTIRVPFPSLCASKRTKRRCSFANVISIFQPPVRFEDSVSASAEENVFTAITRIIACPAFTFFF